LKILDVKLLALAGGMTALLAQGCVMGDGEIFGDPDSDEFLPPLANADELLEGAPKADELDRIHPKADGTLPAQFDLVEYQTPVRNQGRRGTCSIFSTVALMEHLYLVEGTITNPNFAEQYLQWSTKFQLGRFTHTAGSTAQANLEAINRFGIPEDHFWRYETNQWDETIDPACEGDRMPTRCYTNGEPPEEAIAAQKFFLPRSSWLHPQDVKAHMFFNGQAVEAAMDVYYQAWGHGLSNLTLNQDYRARGVVFTPNQEDIRDSLENRAGHSVILVGWDDDLELPRMDASGEPLVDSSGNVVMDRGFYIMKNSWGTGPWGAQNEYGAGYGLISQDYIHQHGSIRIADLPTNVIPPEGEVCPIEDGAVDCTDPRCSAEPVCDEDASELVFEGAGGEIPDNDPVGFSSTIEIDEEGVIAELSVDVNITHTYRGDLVVTLYRGDEAVVLHNRVGGSANDLVATFDLDQFVGTELAGEWRLVVTDNAPLDSGSLDSWAIRAVIQ
jgi:hypothetical protein